MHTLIDKQILPVEFTVKSDLFNKYSEIIRPTRPEGELDPSIPAYMRDRREGRPIWARSWVLVLVFATIIVKIAWTAVPSIVFTDLPATWVLVPVAWMAMPTVALGIIVAIIGDGF